MLRPKLHSPFTVECTEGNLLWETPKSFSIDPLATSLGNFNLYGNKSR